MDPSHDTSASRPATVTGPAIWPTLRSRDLRELIDFYVAAFGFVAHAVYPDSTGQVAHAELAGPHGGGVILGQIDSAYIDPRQHMPALPIRCYVVEPDADALEALFARAVAAGATVVREPYGTPHGTRECEFQDPEGNRWLFGTAPGEIP